MARENRALGLTALNSAIARAHEGIEQGNGETFFAATGETLLWITLIDESLRGVDGYEAMRSESESGHLIPALRYARNRLIHDWQVTGMQGNPLLAEAAHSPVRSIWRDVTDPAIESDYEPRTARDKEGQKIYGRELAGFGILDSLEGARRFLSEAVEVFANGGGS